MTDDEYLADLRQIQNGILASRGRAGGVDDVLALVQLRIDSLTSAGKQMAALQAEAVALADANGQLASANTDLSAKVTDLQKQVDDLKKQVPPPKDPGTVVAASVKGAK